MALLSTATLLLPRLNKFYYKPVLTAQVKAFNKAYKQGVIEMIVSITPLFVAYTPNGVAPAH